MKTYLGFDGSGRLKLLHKKPSGEQLHWTTLVSNENNKIILNKAIKILDLSN
jgi:hypothetical protein